MSVAKSAIDEIFKISEKLESISSSIGVLEKNIKSLNNKFIILTKKVDSIEEKMKQEKKEEVRATEASPPTAKAPDSVSVLKTEDLSSKDTNDKLVLGAVKTYGYIANKDMVPIPGIKVFIFDSSEDRIRDLKTNSDGYWEARLPHGYYKIIYSHEKFNDIIKEIDIPKGSVNFRVT